MLLLLFLFGCRPTNAFVERAVKKNQTAVATVECVAMGAGCSRSEDLQGAHIPSRQAVRAPGGGGPPLAAACGVHIFVVARAVSCIIMRRRHDSSRPKLSQSPRGPSVLRPASACRYGGGSAPPAAAPRAEAPCSDPSAPRSLQKVGRTAAAGRAREVGTRSVSQAARPQSLPDWTQRRRPARGLRDVGPDPDHRLRGEVRPGAPSLPLPSFWCRIGRRSPPAPL